MILALGTEVVWARFHNESIAICQQEREFHDLKIIIHSQFDWRERNK